MVNDKIAVSAITMKWPKYSSPFPLDSSKQEYYDLDIGDTIPEDILERLEKFCPDLIRYLTPEEILKKKNEELIKRGKPEIELKDLNLGKLEKKVKEIPIEETDRYKELKDLKKKEQIKLLEKLGCKDINSLKKESDRILKIIELENK